MQFGSTVESHSLDIIELGIHEMAVHLDSVREHNARRVHPQGEHFLHLRLGGTIEAKPQELERLEHSGVRVALETFITILRIQNSHF